MLTSKEHTDGNIYHARYLLNEEGTDYSEESEFILDETGALIPITACLCHAYEPGECCCATTSWEDYRYDDDDDDYEGDCYD